MCVCISKVARGEKQTVRDIVYISVRVWVGGVGAVFKDGEEKERKKRLREKTELKCVFTFVCVLCFVFECEKERGRERNLQVLLGVLFLKFGSCDLVGCLL